MKKLNLILTIIVLLGFLPINVFAQFDYLDNMINDDKGIYEIAPTTPQTSGSTTDTENISLISCNLVWSAESYVPYDYPGRALAAVDAFVDINVLLEVSGGNPINLQYSWFVDNNFEEQKSGYGKTSFRFGIRKNAGSEHVVLVKIFNDSNTFYFEKSITIPIVNPEIVIYPSIKNSDFSEHGEKNVSSRNNGVVSFVAKPFFFSIAKPSDLTYNWDFSDQKALTSSDYDANILKITLPKKDSSEIVQKNLSVIVSNAKSSWQRAFNSVTLEIY